MTISDAYLDSLKKRVVKDFFEAESRSPTEEEILDLMRVKKLEYSSIDDVGISGFETTKPSFRQGSSATAENANRNAIFDDMKTISTRIDDLLELVEDSFRGFKGTTNRMMRLLRQQESRADNLLLLNGDVDVFVYGVEETFDTQDKIDLDSTTAAIESSYCTMGRDGYSEIALNTAKLTATVTSQQPIVGSQQSSNIELLKENDGSFWEQIVHTKSRQGRVSSIIEMTLDEASYVGDVRISMSNISVNQKTTMSLFYSIDGQTYTAIQPIERVVATGEMSFNIGISGVKKIQIVTSKNVADAETATANQYVYVFSFDSIKILVDGYKTSTESVLFAGPYEVKDELGNAVNFTKATLSACVFGNEDTEVSFFLSKDDINYVPVDYRSDSLDVVSFANGASDATSFSEDGTKGTNSIIEEVEALDDFDFVTEAILNKGVAAAFSDSILIKSIALKRNVTSAISVADVYQMPRGWFFDDATQEYTTTIYIDAPEGKRINVGATGIKVNGSLKTGTVQLASGYSRIATTDSNWIEVPTGLLSETALIDADPLYPYNHRYIIEGYNYSSGFAGDRIYTGMDEYFGKLLTYLPPEKFNAIETAELSDLQYYTIDRVNDKLYFKIKVDKTDASWKDELFDVDWVVQSDSTNEVYVRAILTTSNPEHTPMIEDFMIRVI